MNELNPKLPEETSLKPYRSGLYFGFFNGMNWMICLGTPMVMMAGQLGASTFQVGLAYAAVFLTLPIQVFATAFLPRFGYKNQMMFAWRARSMSLFIPFGLALAAPVTPAPWMANLLVISVYLFCILRGLGSCCYVPWFYALLPEQIRGRYFASDQLVSGFGGVFTLLLCAGLFKLLPGWTAYTVIYAMAIMGAVLSNYFLSKLPDVPKPAGTSLRRVIQQTPQLCFTPGPFRYYMLLTLVQSLAWSSFAPFTAYYLKFETPIKVDSIMLFTACQYLGGIAGALFIRNRIDRFGTRPVFTTSLVVSTLAILFWLVMISGFHGLLIAVPLCSFVAGLSASLWATAHLKYLPQVCPVEHRALATSVQSAVVGFLGGLSPMIIGFFIKHTGNQPGMDAGRFAIYFGIAALLQLSLLIPFARLNETAPETASLFSDALLLRPFRYFGSLINFIDTPDKAKKDDSKEG
ncbi:MAG: MFS transporter [Verrucomicrobiota bacterium]|nr:MFS transporter [Verrucomicrobiota bacterium]